jgi:hypothetical protein
LNVAYKNGIETAAEATVTALEAVKMVSEITLVVGAVVGTGGAAALGFGSGVAITAADDLAPALAGGKVGWAKFAFDMALAYVLKKRLQPSRSQRLSGRSSARRRWRR